MRFSLKLSGFPATISLISALIYCLDAAASTTLFGYDYEVYASSSLTDGNRMYAATNVIAPSLSTAWCEGVQGLGDGEWIELKVKNPTAGGLELALLPGYAKTDSLYINNGRPSQIAILINGLHRQEIQIEDLAREQLFRLNVPPDEKITTIKLTILGVAPGAKHEDTCITEILVLPTERVSTPISETQAAQEARRVQELIDLSRASKLEALEELIRLSSGQYIRTAEGGEYLYEIYADLFVLDPYRFLFVTLRQNADVTSRTLDALINPISDKYTSTQLLHALDVSVNKGIDPRLIQDVQFGLLERKKALKD